MFQSLTGILTSLQDLLQAVVMSFVWGSKGTPIEVLELGTDNINKKILEENKVELNSEQVKSLLKYLPKWARKVYRCGSRFRKNNKRYS